MITNNEAVENFLNGKRNLAAYQFSQLIREITLPNTDTISNLSLTATATTQTASSSGDQADTETTFANSTTSTNTQAKQQLNSDEIAFNYAMVNLFTGCPQRASIIFSDLVKRYPRNPRLWLRLAESMLAAERAKMSEFEHIQQLSYPHSRDHLIKTKNKPILVKINPNYCQQQMQQQFQTQRGTQSNFLVTIKGYLQKSLDLINEYNDISLLTDDIPNDPLDTVDQQQASQMLGSGGVDGGSSIGSPFSTTNESISANNNKSSSSQAQATNKPALPSMKLSKQLSYANPYKSISRSALYHLRNKVQLNLAYICLCMGEPVKALNFTTQCLRSSPQGYEKVLASLYHAEACILASRIDEAIQFLNLEILNMAKSLSQDHPLVIGDTKRTVYGDEMQHQFDSGALATVVTYNLGVAYAAKGEFNNAQKILMRCIQPTKPNPMQVIICLLYTQLQQGQLESAKRTILSNLPQFR